MKTRLLRKLRKKVRIKKYTDGTYSVDVGGWYGEDFDSLEEARICRRQFILEEARSNYYKRSVLHTKTFD